MTINELLSDYYHYKALYDIHKEDAEDSQQIELILRSIIIKLKNYNVTV